MYNSAPQIGMHCDILKEGGCWMGWRRWWRGVVADIVWNPPWVLGELRQCQPHHSKLRDRPEGREGQGGPKT